ncbi:hypothetical protein FACS1894176_02390 [Bacteroidia bacterium]|nr:hypothetical protein FACS1894176_02390 [Bacteroidia bacterium]
MLQQLNLNAKDVICFENVEESVINATSVGITTYHYDRIKKDIKKLKDFLDSNL